MSETRVVVTGTLQSQLIVTVGYYVVASRTTFCLHGCAGASPGFNDGIILQTFGTLFVQEPSGHYFAVISGQKS